jgi:radical SAM superfamily enzyme YgiQ (UPF0313 family)
MKLLLVDNLILPQEGSLAHLDVHPHLGLLALAAVAETDGHRVQIFDPKRLIRSGELLYDESLYDTVAARLLALEPDVVGFTTLGCSVLFAVNVASRLKRCEPDLPVMLGGPHATMLHREILARFPQFDVVARYECDETLPAILDHMEQRRFEFIPGVSWRVSPGTSGLRFTDGKPKVLDLDALPISSYDHYPVTDLNLDLLRIEAGRGCPFACTFCSTAGFFQRSFRLKSAGRLVQELDILHERYGFDDFKLDHDMFTVSKRKVLEFCEAVRGRGYRWRASARVDCVDEHLLGKMAEAGCVNLYFGIETGSARMQKVCQKRLDLGLVHPILGIAEGLGIETTASFITGYPEEEEQDQNETLDMLGACFRPSCLPQLHILAPEPGTPMSETHGSELRYDGYAGPYNAEPIGRDDDSLVLGHPDLFQTYHYYPAAMPRAKHVFAVEAFARCRRLGPTILRYILSAYDGALSKLVRGLESYVSDRWPGECLDDRMVDSYFRCVFGEDHHVASLCRYALATNRGGGERRLASPAAVARFDPGSAYRLHNDVRILTNMHDCEVLIRRIERGESTSTIDAARDAERGVYVLTCAGERVDTYRAEAGVDAILDMFRTPRRCDDVARELSRLIRAPVDSNVFEALAQIGAIVPCNADLADCAP